ncbi:MAG TPA: MurT ligase domain-containing protein [Syntrophomonas sp.]|nr:MurT ligase domain-containing protein [Syntrophomonas sp.]
MGLRMIIAIMAGKLAIFLSRMAGNQGTDFPGRLARKICPPILSELAGHVDQEIIIVTGTNGKTTTSNMIAEILRENGNAYVHNRAGANMLTGITTAFIKATSISGRRRFDYALLETDEANVPLLLREVKASLMLVTNFFRDQLDRYGELDHTISLIKEAARDGRLELILNADDPLQSDFAEHVGTKCWHYGFDDTIYDELTSADSREGRYCVRCGQELSYQRYHYAQLGAYRCPQCGNHNPVQDFTGRALKMEAGISLSVNELSLQSSYQGFYNAYNILAAVAMGKRLGIDDDVIQRAIFKFQPRAGRMEKFVIDGKPCLLVLVKNPTGLNQSLNMLMLDQRSKSLFIALNDNAADGRDISWIWDADVEAIIRPEAGIRKIVCSGQRSGDIALRIKYAGYPVDDIMIESRLREGIALTIAQETRTAFIVCTYTALFPCRQIMLKMQRQSGGAAGESYRSPVAAGQEE